MKIKKVISVLLTCSMLGVSLCSCGSGVADTLQEKAFTAAADEEVLKEMVTKVARAGSSEATKEETVYVKTDATGNVDSVIVSNWLKNLDGTAELEDETTLTDIVNVKGKENYKAEGNKLTWETDGDDIYYQGTTDKKIPVDVNITYELDGKEIPAEEMAGKSGHAVITIGYKNNSANNVEINGKEETIYTPFAAVSALTLNDEKFKDVKVTGGTAVSDGKRNIIVGMAFPGLVESLNGGKSVDSEVLEEIEDKIDIPEKVVIEADVEDFELGTTVTLVTSDITKALGLDMIDTDSEDKLNEIKDSVEEFSDAGNKLTEGTGELQDGAQKLSDGSKTLQDGMGSLYGGIVEYTDGVGKVADGASALDKGAGELNSGAGQLRDGIGQAISGSDALNSGISSVEDAAKQVSDGASAINAKMPELESGAESLRDGVGTLVGTVEGITDGVGSAAGAAGQISAGIDQVVAATSQATDPSSIDVSQVTVTGTVSAETASGAMNQAITSDKFIEGLQKAGLNETQIQTVIDMVDSAASQVIPAVVDSATDATAKKVAAQSAANGANEVKSQINAALTTAGESGMSLQSGASALSSSLLDSYNTMSSDETKGKLEALSAGADALCTGTSQLGEGINKLADGTAALYGGTTQLSQGAGSLSSGLSQLYTGAGSLVSGTESLKAGTSSLVSGTNKLSSASGELINGSKSLVDGSAELSGGLGELLEGSKKLNDGMIRFNDEGIEKLTKVFDTDLGSMKERLNAITRLGRDYTTFSGTAEGEESTVKFIIESSEIKKL